MKKLLFLATLLITLGCTSATAQIPSANIKNKEGKSINAQSLANDGKPFVVTFFATWCPPCREELATVNKVYADWQKETGVKIFTVSVDQPKDEEKVHAMFQTNGYKYELLLDQNGEFAKAMKVSSIPNLYLFDGKGKIVYSHVGFTPGDEATLHAKIKEAMR